MSPKSSVAWTLLGLLFAAPVLPGALAAKPDPFVGTWVLNLAKSRYSPGPAPRSQAVAYESVKGGLQVKATGVDGMGNPTRTEYAAVFDGKDYPATGSPDWDMIAWRRVSSHRINFTRKKGGKVVQTGTIVVSADGKTRTVTAEGTTASGAKLHNVSVYERKA
jgi:hypothetical protein